MADLKTNYKDDVLDTTQNTKRKYQMIDNGDGTVSFEDVTEYLQQGDSFGANDINDTNEEVNIINDNLALKQPLSDILTQLVNSQIKHYKIIRHIKDVPSLRSFLVDATVGEGIELVSFKSPDGRQSGFMITSATSSTYYAGVFFGYYLDDFVYFTRAGEANTIKIYKFTKTLQS